MLLARWLDVNQRQVQYLSDVTAGAAVGIIAGRTVTRHGRENFPVTVMALPGGPR
jgi:hypothetical protein